MSNSPWRRLKSRVKSNGSASHFLTTGTGQKLRQVSAVYDPERKFTLLALRIAEYPTGRWTYVAINDQGGVVAITSGHKTYKEADEALAATLA